MAGRVQADNPYGASMKPLSLARRAVLPLALVCGALGASAQRGAAQTAAPAPPPGLNSRAQIQAVRSERALKVDGRLDEPVWQQATFIREFVQREPREKQVATQRTEVAFVYTEDALYIGARLQSDSTVRALITRRDREDGGSDQLMVSLDTYLDRRTAYTFAVTAAGVRIDYYHPADFEFRREYTYDPVWEAETDVDSAGWTAEIRIPFTQLRFGQADQQVWGVNIARLTPARNEVAFWQLVGRNETGWASRMGELHGIQGIRPTRRAELLPYVASDTRVVSSVDERNPFAKKQTSGLRAGGDLKLGLGSNFTIDATFNPDFGQVEADPAEVNLSAFETFFAERRPFFLEGTQLLNARGNFYSRRIGARPLTPNATYSEPLDNTTILGAAKLTGRTAKGLSVAALTALTAHEKVETFDAATSRFGEAVVAPATGYAIAALQQEFGNVQRTSAAAYALITHVERDLEPGSFLANSLARRAHSGIVDYRVRWKGGQYDLSAFVAWSYLQGDSSAILAQQLSSRRYFQRPDADHVDVDPSKTSLFGTYLGINHSKLSGKHWLWDIDYFQEAPGFELNDAGRLGGTDDRGVISQLRYRETTPGKYLRSYEFSVLNLNEWNFGGDRQFSLISASSMVTLRNFWQGWLFAEGFTRGQSDNLTRGGPSMGTGQSMNIGLQVANRAGSRTRLRGNISRGFDEFDGGSLNASAGISLRPGTQWEVTFDPRFFTGTTSRQFITSVGNGRPETLGRRYVFSFVDRSEVAARIRVNYAVTPDLTLETYAEPFASAGRFYDFGELAAARSRDLITYGTRNTSISAPDSLGRRQVTDGSARFTLPNLDFNVRSFRSNMVLRWEWRPGSTLFAVWQQNRGQRDPIGRAVRPGDVFDSFSAPGDNFFALKLNYWLPLH